MKTNNTPSTIKHAAAVIGIIAAGLLGFAALYIFIWACYYAGFRM